MPLFLVKRIGQRHALRVSDLPVSLCDIPSSIAEEFGIEASFECESIFSQGASRRTPRFHYRHLGVEENRKRPKKLQGFFHFDKYSVEGHSWRSDSWILRNPPGQAAKFPD